MLYCILLCCVVIIMLFYVGFVMLCCLAVYYTVLKNIVLYHVMSCCIIFYHITLHAGSEQLEGEFQKPVFLGSSSVCLYLVLRAPNMSCGQQFCEGHRTWILCKAFSRAQNMVPV